MVATKSIPVLILFAVLLLGVGSHLLGEDAPSIEAVLDLSTDRWVEKPSETSDRALPAGSLYKVATALAALESGIPRDREHLCTGEACWYRPGHGRLNLRGALAHSCSAYFANLSSEIERSQLLMLAEALGFEPGGRLPNPQAFAGDDRSLCIRPTRAAALMAFIAGGRSLDTRPVVGESTRLEVRQALLDSVSYGTSAELQRFLPRAGAKTGTSFPEGGELIGWCAGFLPNRYAFAVVVRGRTSRQGAVPAAARLLRDLRWSDK
jgi:cell division protein FtsI/penicillin-binding protein 2